MKNVSSTNYQQEITYNEGGLERRNNKEKSEIKKNMGSAFFRGTKGVRLNPYEKDYEDIYFLKKYVLQGWAPVKPVIDCNTQITAFGSCFAQHISNHLENLKYNLTAQKSPDIYISYMGEGMVNVHAIAQQFEWALEDKQIPNGLWHGYRAEDYGVDETVRLKTKKAFQETDFFILTLGLSEVWEDIETGEIFWRAVPVDKFDENRHRFRVLSMSETKLQISKIYSIIRKNIPTAKVLFTLSPVPLAATFRQISCISANSISKSILRASLDEFLRESNGDLGENLFYFPSYEVISELFYEKYENDCRHPQPEIIELIMKMFEGMFCESQLDWSEVEQLYKILRKKNLEHAFNKIQQS